MASSVPPFDKKKKKAPFPPASPFGGPNPKDGKKPNPFAKKGK
jgi:hypothetical protein